MPPPLMAFVCLIGIVGLFVLERDKGSRSSKALWIPVAWLFINCSRPASLWLDALGLRGFSVARTAQVYVEGSPVDAAVFSFLLIAGLIVLAHRTQQLRPLFGKMVPILIFFLYCALSILWADHPLVAFKHWSKGIGDLVMVLVVLTDPEPAVAFKRLLSGLGFVLLPLSILFIKYYPSIGRAYTPLGFNLYSGVTLQKNTLGVICLIFGLGFLWRFLAVYRDRGVARRTKLLTAYGIILAMALWLLWMSNSMTSISCFVMASALLVLANRPMMTRRPAVVHILVAAMVGFSLFALFFDASGDIIKGLGRNPTLTGRTAIWSAVLPFAGNPLIGTGYESFWVGKRVEEFWAANNGALNGITEAHNGYLELYLNLGWIGVALLAGLIVLGYRKVIATLRADPQAGSIGLAFFVSEIVYNYAEAGFRMMFPLWIFFLLAVLGIPTTPPPQNPSTIENDFFDDIIAPETDVDHALGVASCAGINSGRSEQAVYSRTSAIWNYFQRNR
jgi:exopolysaccharide production protein ExoQ